MAENRGLNFCMKNILSLLLPSAFCPLPLPFFGKIEPYPKVNPQPNQTKMGGQIKSNT
jgi:hypothetical protein